ALLLSASALVIVPATAHAQETVTTPAPVAQDAAAPVTGGDSYDIVVTASKRAENLSDVPMSITAITGDSLQEKGINSVQDLVKVTPGLSFVQSALSTPVYSLRGVGFYDTSIGA